MGEVGLFIAGGGIMEEERYEKCPECNGSGVDEVLSSQGTGQYNCGACSGTGYIAARGNWLEAKEAEGKNKQQAANEQSRQ